MTENNKQGNKIMIKIIVVAIFLALVILVLMKAKNYLKDDVNGKTNLIINNSNVTTSLKRDVFIEGGIIYLSKADIENFFDPYIFYDEQYHQIITSSSTKLATIPMEGTKIQVNSSNKKVKGVLLQKDDTYYIPFSELEDVYQVKVSYIKENDVVVIDSLDRNYTVATTKKNVSVKYRPTNFSRTVEKVNGGETLIIANRSDYPVPDGWTRVRTQNGTLGYVKTNSMGEMNQLRQAIQKEKKIKEPVSLMWDYYSTYVYAPNRTGTTMKGINVVSPSFFALEKLGKGNVKANIEEQGKAYITWAHQNGYQIWPILSNDSMIQTTSEIMHDYKLREKLINEIVNNIVQYHLDGINIDFENMYEADKKLFSQFLIELAPRLNEIGAVLSVDVTAPDGSDTWSMCYDRNTIGKVVDYMIFMGYDQYGGTSPQEGTTAGCDWVEANINKFLGQEGVSSEKLVLGIPLYTRLWKEQNGKISSDTVDVKDVNSVIPSSVKKQWNENLKQNYVEYTQNGATYKMWIEDEKSIEEKLNLIEKYKLVGAAYWEKDRENNQILELIANKLGI
ncbi:MAG: hypothetical protein IJ777_01505 [Clostridia bacterium]|nr:hypothetical protein [Clostridia bacterium]